MAECPYCVGNHFLSVKIEDAGRVEMNIISGQAPYLDIKVNQPDGILGMHVGFSISYCPMCGRRLGLYNA